MTDEQIRVAIAEACGWRFHPDGCGYFPPGGNEWIGRGYKSLAECVPDYPNDLNAMHEAEATLDAYHREQYTDTLIILASRQAEFVAELSEVSLRWNGLHATARQRAEAFLRTLGKWTE